MKGWKAGHNVVVLLVLLFGITYLDRICISVAGPRIQEELHIGPVGWGWVTGVFTISYCLFEIPSGMLADRIGPRRVLTRIVLWWSTFTALTGAVTGFYPLLVTRFLFGAGEAGAFPSAAAVISRWFPASRRATMSGVTLMASQIGGALAPLLVVPIQIRFGWRASFYVFGALGICWAVAWYAWFRDSPPGPVEQLRERTSPERPGISNPVFPWRLALRSSTVTALLGTAFCYVYVYNFFQTWFHTFLVKGRGFSEFGLLLSALPYVVAVFANLAGGAASDALVRKLGSQTRPEHLGSGSTDHRRPVHGRGHDFAATNCNRGLSGHRLRGDHVPAIRGLWRLLGHRAKARRCDGRSDEYRVAVGRARGFRGVRLHRRALRELQCTIRSHGGTVVPRRAALAQD